MKKSASKILCFLLLVSCLFLGSCRIKLEFSAGNPSVLTSGAYSLYEDEMRLIALQYKCVYEKCYQDILTESFWSMPILDTTFEEYVKKYFVLQEARALLFLNRLYEEKENELSPFVVEELKEKAAVYYTGFSEDEKAFFHGDEDTVFRVLSLYAKAGEMINELVKNGDMEVSEEESRVLTCEVIRMQDKERAESVYERAKGGESFSYLAKTFSLDETILYSVSRENVTDAFSEELFSMKENEISSLIFHEGNYYLFRIFSIYDSLLSTQNRLNLLALKRYHNWSQIFEEYMEDGKEDLSQSFYRDLTLSTEGEFPYFSLFE